MAPPRRDIGHLGGKERGESGRQLESSRPTAILLVTEVILLNGAPVWCMVDVERRLGARMKTCRGRNPIHLLRRNQNSHAIASFQTYKDFQRM